MIANLSRTIKMKDARQITTMAENGSSVDDISAQLNIHVDSVATYVDGLSKAEEAPAKAPAKKKAATKKAAREETPE